MLIDAIRLFAINLEERPNSVLNLSSGATVILDNDSPCYLESIYIDNERFRGALKVGNVQGVTILGTGRMNTIPAPGGTLLMMK